MFEVIMKACVRFICILLCICSFFSFTACKKAVREPYLYPPPDHKYQNMPVVIIDAGHGGEDGGAVGVDGSLEKDINLAIALELAEMLRAVGIRVRLTRTEDILLYDRNSDYKGHKKVQDARERLRIAEEYEDAVFISIHMNSFPEEKYKGLQVYYSVNSPMSSALATIVQQMTATNLQRDNQRKIKPSQSGIYLLEKIRHPAILVECGFLSNREDCANLNSPSYRSRLCLVLFASVCKYFDGTGS